MTFETIIGTVAGILTSASMLPQLVMVIRTKETSDLSAVTIIVLLAGVSLWVYYRILKTSSPSSYLMRSPCSLTSRCWYAWRLFEMANAKNKKSPLNGQVRRLPKPQGSGRRVLGKAIVDTFLQNKKYALTTATMPRLWRLLHWWPVAWRPLIGNLGVTARLDAGMLAQSPYRKPTGRKSGSRLYA